MLLSDTYQAGALSESSVCFHHKHYERSACCSESIVSTVGICYAKDASSDRGLQGREWVHERDRPDLARLRRKLLASSLLPGAG